MRFGCGFRPEGARSLPVVKRGRALAASQATGTALPFFFLFFVSPPSGRTTLAVRSRGSPRVVRPAGRGEEKDKERVVSRTPVVYSAQSGLALPPATVVRTPCERRRLSISHSQEPPRTRDTSRSRCLRPSGAPARSHGWNERSECNPWRGGAPTSPLQRSARVRPFGARRQEQRIHRATGPTGSTRLKAAAFHQWLRARAPSEPQAHQTCAEGTDPHSGHTAPIARPVRS